MQSGGARRRAGALEARVEWAIYERRGCARRARTTARRNAPDKRMTRQDICEHECGGDRRNNQNTPCRDACDAAERRPFSLGIEYTLDGFSAAPKSNQRMSAARLPKKPTENNPKEGEEGLLYPPGGCVRG